jgi:hypothetical protein
MANVFITLGFLLSLIFKLNNAMPMPFPDILIDANAHYCKSIVTYMVAECLPYFLEDNSKPNYPCCSAFQAIASHDTSCSCICDTIKGDMIMEITKIMKLPTICSVSIPCSGKSLISSVTIFIPYLPVH